MPPEQARNRRLATALTAAIVVVGLTAGACSHDEGSVDDFCKQVKRLPPLETVLRGYTELDAQELQARLDAARTGYDELVDVAPSDIEDDVDLLDRYVRVVVEAVADHPSDPDAVEQDIKSSAAELRGASAASQRVVAYAKQECGVDLDAG